MRGPLRALTMGGPPSPPSVSGGDSLGEGTQRKGLTGGLSLEGGR